MADQGTPRPITPVFVSSKLDDLGLSLGAFRVTCHLQRRGADKISGAWPSAASIGVVCGIKDTDTVWKYLNEAIAAGVLRRENRSGLTNVWFLNPESQWKQKSPTRKNRAPRKTRLTGNCEAVPENSGHPLPEETGCPLPGKTGHEGDPLKAIQKGDPVKGGSLALATTALSRVSSLDKEIQFPWDSHEELPDLFWRMKRYQLQVTLDYLFRAFHEIRGRKLRFRDKSYFRGWQSVLETELDAYVKNRRTAPRTEDKASTEDGQFLSENEVDRFGDFAALKAAGILVKPHGATEPVALVNTHALNQ